MKRFSFALVGLMLAAPAFAGEKAAAPKAHVFFVEPKDGATVPEKFTVKMGLEGMTLEPAGPPKEGTGHHHLLIDRKPLKKGTAVPVGETSLHFGKAQTETELTLKPGKHSLTLQLGDGNHLSYGPELSATIHVTVEGAPKK